MSFSDGSWKYLFWASSPSSSMSSSKIFPSLLTVAANTESGLTAHQWVAKSLLHHPMGWDPVINFFGQRNHRCKCSTSGHNHTHPLRPFFKFLIKKPIQKILMKLKLWDDAYRVYWLPVSPLMGRKSSSDLRRYSWSLYSEWVFQLLFSDDFYFSTF